MVTKRLFNVFNNYNYMISNERIQKQITGKNVEDNCVLIAVTPRHLSEETEENRKQLLTLRDLKLSQRYW